MHEFADGVLDHFGLIGDLVDIDALRHRAHEFGGGGGDVLAEFEDVGALGGDDADAERGLAFLAHHEARRIDIAVGDGGDIAQPKHPAIAFDRRLGHGLDAIERAGDAQRHALRGGFHRAGGHTLFCLASESNSACGVMPKVASLACENSTKIRSSCTPYRSTLVTPGTFNSRWRMPSAAFFNCA